MVASHSAGRGDDVMNVLKDFLALHPANRDILSALVAFNRGGTLSLPSNTPRNWRGLRQTIVILRVSSRSFGAKSRSHQPNRATPAPHGLADWCVGLEVQHVSWIGGPYNV